MMILTGKTVASAIRPPYPYGSEFVGQFLFAMKLCWFPLLVSTVAFGYGAPGLQAANFLVLFGALDRLGRCRGSGARRQPGGGDRVSGGIRVQLRVHSDAACHPSRDHHDHQVS